MVVLLLFMRQSNGTTNIYKRNNRFRIFLVFIVAIVAIGLFFAILFQRSRNLAMIAILHGLGDWFIDGLAQIAHMAP